MDSSFGEGYISQVKQRQTQQGQTQSEFDDKNTTVVTIAGDVALDRLRNILLAINGISLFIIPALSWYLAKKSLAPVQIAHEKQKSFVSDASHELRTPIAIMIGEIDIALNKQREIKEYQVILQSNKEELIRLSTLVTNLLLLAREDQNKSSIHSETIDLTDLLSSVSSQLKPIYSKKRLKVTFQPVKESIVVKGNPGMLYQLFYNLLDNAVKYTEKGSILVTLDQDKKYVTCVIKDTGMGINELDQALLFDRFFRVDAARSETKGYGLGLAICQAIVKRHNGTITVTSSPQKGSTFTVLLPRHQ